MLTKALIIKHAASTLPLDISMNQFTTIHVLTIISFTLTVILFLHFFSVFKEASPLKCFMNF